MKLPLQPYRPLLVACETPLEHLSHAGSDDSRNCDGPLSPREWYRQRKLAKETQMAKAPAKKAAAKAPATPNVTPETPNFTPDVEAAAERIKATSERVLELSKENGLIWLEAYEKML